MASKENANRSTPPPTVRVTKAKTQKPCKEGGRLDPKGEVKATGDRPRKVSTPLPIKKIICNDCGRSYSSRDCYNRHKRHGTCARAAQGAKWTRPATVKITKSSKKGDKHDPARTTCVDCSRSYSRRRDCDRHRRTGVCKLGKQEQFLDGMFHCVYCQDTPCKSCDHNKGCSYKTLSALRTHHTKIHHFCRMCQKEFESDDAFQKHFPCPPVIMPQGSSSKDMASTSPVLKCTRNRARLVSYSSSESDSESLFESPPESDSKLPSESDSESSSESPSESDSELPEQLSKTLSRDSNASGPDDTTIMPMSPPTAQEWETSASSPSVLVEETIMCPSQGRGGPQTPIRPFLILSPLSRTEMNVTHVPETPATHQSRSSPA